MKRKLIYLFIAFAAAILPAHAQKFLNDELTLSNVSLWQQGNSLYVGMTFDMSKLTKGLYPRTSHYQTGTDCSYRPL